MSQRLPTGASANPAGYYNSSFVQVRIQGDVRLNFLALVVSIKHTFAQLLDNIHNVFVHPLSMDF